MNQGQLETSLTSLSPPSFRIQKLRRDTSANILEMTEKSVRTLLTFSTTFRHGVLKWIPYTLCHLSLTTISVLRPALVVYTYPETSPITEV